MRGKIFSLGVSLWEKMLLNMNGENKCKNCEKEKIVELAERVTKLEKDLQKQAKQDKQTKFLGKVIFWGAVASGFNAIFGLASMIISWIERIKR